MKMWIQIILLILLGGILESAVEGLGVLILIITGISYYINKKNDNRKNSING